MLTQFDPAIFGQTVLAVPPLARDASMRVALNANAQLIRYLRAGGVTTYLYGGNANFYHLGIADFAETLAMMRSACPDDGLMIPSAGPDYGKLLDQAAVLERANFPLVMVLPASHPATAAGAERAIRDFVGRLGQGVMLYVKTELLDANAIGRLFDDQVVSVVKYAVPRADLLEDTYLADLLTVVPAARIISGFGEMPALGHLRHFGLAGFTAGCVCLAPRLSTALLRACQSGDWAKAEQIQAYFAPMEAWRDRVDPISVLHYALGWAGLIDMGEILPALSQPDERWRDEIASAARTLLAVETTYADTTGSLVP